MTAAATRKTRTTAYAHSTAKMGTSATAEMGCTAAAATATAASSAASTSSSSGASEYRARKQNRQGNSNQDIES
jgi:hypothetical protein